MVQLDAVIDLHTFSIVARDPRTGDLGAAGLRLFGAVKL
jgi:hypothetical protein